jgi:hypothetical protein
MKDLNPPLSHLCLLELDLLKDTRNAASEETGSNSGQDQKIMKCKARERTLEER